MKPHTKGACIRSWSFAGMAWADLQIIIAPGGFTAWVEIKTCAESYALDKSAWQCLRAWIASTLLDPEYIPTTVRRLWLIHRKLHLALDCHIAHAP